MGPVVLVDDDPITHLVVKGAVETPFAFQGFTNLKDARAWLIDGSAPSLLIIDRILTDGDGISLCREVRTNPYFSGTPIIFLSGRDSEFDKVNGLYAGADDYIAKPVGPLELRARIQARLRNSLRTVSCGDVSIDLYSHRAHKGLGRDRFEIELTRIELKILTKLIETPDRVFSRNAIIDHVWGPSTHINDRVVDTHISHLRKKLAGTSLSIENLRGEGYRIVDRSNLRQAA